MRRWHKGDGREWSMESGRTNTSAVTAGLCLASLLGEHVCADDHGENGHALRATLSATIHDHWEVGATHATRRRRNFWNDARLPERRLAEAPRSAAVVTAAPIGTMGCCLHFSHPCCMYVTGLASASCWAGVDIVRDGVGGEWWEAKVE